MTETADVVIVGGGIIGASCADALAEAGLDVVLLERDGLAAGASGRNQGLFAVPTDPANALMAEASLRRYLEIVPSLRTPVGLDPDPIGYLLVATDEEEAAAGDEHIAPFRDLGRRVERLDAAGIREIEPHLAPGVAAAWLVDDGRRLDPTSLTVGLALRAADRGASVRTHSSVRSLRADGDRVTGVVTDGGTIDAKDVVLAAGPWSTRLARDVGLRLAVTGARGWLVHLDPERALLRRIVEQAGRRIWRDPVERMTAGSFAGGAEPPPDIGALVHSTDDGSVYAGSSRRQAIQPEPEDPQTPRSIVRSAIRLIPALADAAVSSAWWGVRPMTPDERPLVGRVREGLVVATGHGSEGVILSGGTAELVQSIVLDRPPPFEPAPFDPQRL